MSTRAQTTQTQTQAQAQAQPTGAVVYPLVDVFESDGEFLLVADLPGVAKDALEMTVEDGELRLVARGEQLEYRRSFALGDDVDLDAIDANFEQGELRLRLPKRAQARVRKIVVNA
ncbi:Hsp20/alpha crystallin family protein [Pseudenhygromyxa sp. WMMC2535]|uniref:Hsp20/alpha crystallin family protein n=1 Tax=Pseudenhygromyxa sp. WMMC2535 TaxID=2712867 RepID=UPI001554AE9D|nr:Hsp20/alpha crystallin family protein [Pseudenhygromyxa sp. WMMC2535]NVB37423.1 Hsp20/alpha crystallin family protein [Pseudenhygromyxa sp. WMMC2535]